MTMQKVSALMGSLTALLIAQHASAQPPATTMSTPSDNTQSNRIDPSNTRMTADAQYNDSTDLNLTRRIRKDVLADRSLSTYAHNVKIVAVGGTITLNGVVRSGMEKSRVATIAMRVAGEHHVVNDLKIAKPQS